MTFICAARRQGTAGGNDPADCEYPNCVCNVEAGTDPLADAPRDGTYIDVTIRLGHVYWCGGTHYGSYKCPFIPGRCAVCGDETVLACSDCAINSGGTRSVHVCQKTECREAHEAAVHGSESKRSTLDRKRGEDRADHLTRILRAILHADERGQGTPYAEAMEAAAKAVGWKQQEANDVRSD
jgi:hypothetical protein